MTDDLFGDAPPPASPAPPPRRSRRPQADPAPPPPPAPATPLRPATLDRHGNLIEPGVMPEGKGWRVNDGTKPRSRKRAAVKLRNGHICGLEPVTKDSKLGWDIETTRWTLTGRESDVEFFKLHT